MSSTRLDPSHAPQETVQEIFSAQVLMNARFPDLINDNADVIAGSFVLPDESLADVPQAMRQSSLEIT